MIRLYFFSVKLADDTSTKRTLYCICFCGFELIETVVAEIMFAVGHFEGGIFGCESFEALITLKFVREIHFKFTV